MFNQFSGMLSPFTLPAKTLLFLIEFWPFSLAVINLRRVPFNEEISFGSNNHSSIIYLNNSAANLQELTPKLDDLPNILINFSTISKLFFPVEVWIFLMTLSPIRTHTFSATLGFSSGAIPRHLEEIPGSVNIDKSMYSRWEK